MIIVTPLSEDFLYWAPEEICSYPLPPGPEDAWFIEHGDGADRVAPEEVCHVRA